MVETAGPASRNRVSLWPARSYLQSPIRKEQVAMHRLARHRAIVARSTSVAMAICAERIRSMRKFKTLSTSAVVIGGATTLVLAANATAMAASWSGADLTAAIPGARPRPAPPRSARYRRAAAAAAAGFQASGVFRLAVAALICSGPGAWAADPAHQFLDRGWLRARGLARIMRPSAEAGR